MLRRKRTPAPSIVGVASITNAIERTSRATGAFAAAAGMLAVEPDALSADRHALAPNAAPGTHEAADCKT